MMSGNSNLETGTLILRNILNLHFIFTLIGTRNSWKSIIYVKLDMKNKKVSCESLDWRNLKGIMAAFFSVFLLVTDWNNNQGNNSNNKK